MTEIPLEVLSSFHMPPQQPMVLLLQPLRPLRPSLPRMPLQLSLRSLPLQPRWQRRLQHRFDPRRTLPQRCHKRARLLH